MRNSKRKAATRSRKIGKRTKRRRSKPVTTTAIVPASAPAPLAPIEPRYQGRVMPREKVELIKRTVCKEADDSQLALFLHVCESHGLDPFRKQVYAIFFNNDDSRHGRGPKDMVIITGIDGLSMMAARDHKDYGGVSSAKHLWFDPPQKTPAGRMIPETATVKVHRKGVEPIEITVYWEEFAPVDLRSSRSDFWNRMPKNQLEKCAQAKGLRREFPGLGNIFIIQEMAQRLAEQTPEGRQIVNQKGFSPSGQAITHDARRQSENSQDPERLEAIERLRTRGLWCDQHNCPTVKCPADEHSEAENEAMVALMEREGVKPTSPADWNKPIDVKPQPSSGVKDRPENKATKTASGNRAGGAKSPARQASGETETVQPSVVKGTVERVFVTIKGEKSMAMVTLAGVGHKTEVGCWDKDIYKILHDALGKLAEVFTRTKGPYTNIIGLKNVAGTEYINGKTPVAKKREAGQRTLY